MDGQDEIIDFLSDPATFAADRVEHTQTHASHVFLAGQRAYKLKRAVRYSYLDYATPDRRRAACQAELEVNCRFAPNLYLGVQPVTRRDGRLQLGGDGAPVDWLVVMHRFDAALQLDHVAARGDLSPALLDRLADRLAELHAQAEPRPDAGDLARVVADTAQNLREHQPDMFDPARVERWTAHATAALAAHAALLDRRRRAHRVRACHGDLHLRNICLIDGEPTPFDAIEFDPALSSIDVLYDLAFLLMDLLARGLAAEANRVFNRYLDRSDDADGLPALPLFLSLRAGVRAIVAAAADDPAKATRYLDLALDLIDCADEPRLIAIGGLSGTGKSTLARALAPTIGGPPGARLLRSDVLRKRHAGVAPEATLPPSAYTSQTHAEVYRTLLAETRLCLQAGCAVIADAVWATSDDPAALAALARQTGVPFTGLWLSAPLQTLLQRVEARTGDASDATAEIVRRQAASNPKPPPQWHEIAAAPDPDTVLAAARATL